MVGAVQLAGGRLHHLHRPGLHAGAAFGAGGGRLSAARRFGADAVDAVVIVPVGVGLLALTSSDVLRAVGSFVLTMAYFGLLGPEGTLGKRVMEVRVVVAATGDRMSAARALGRWLCVVLVFQLNRVTPHALWWLPFVILFGPCLAGRGQRALHDRVVGTVVEAAP
ncbi:MAG TPA: RDD family protein [Acidimicrobiales bacterium]|nr:RDD family protein [Acidimicrobiales bacterium]